jgi:transcriptional regulator with XRE-family HTH domain
MRGQVNNKTKGTTLDNLTPGKRIAAEREAQGLKQGDLAKLAGISQGSLSELEGGQSKQPAGDTLMRLSKALRVHPNWVITGKKPKHFDYGFDMDKWEEKLTKEQRQQIQDQMDYFAERNDQKPSSKK